MDPKVLLMPVYTRGNEIERLRGALSLATFFNAHLDVLYAQTKPSDLLDNELFALSSKVRERVVSIMDEGARSLEDDVKSHFEGLCKERNVALSETPAGDKPTAFLREIEGARSELVALQGRVSDLVIIPHSKTGGATLTFEQALLHTGRPVLLVPRGMWEFKLTNVLIGWNGGLEAARAVQQSLPFLSRATSVTIATSREKVTETPTGGDLANYLGYHGIKAELQTLNDSAQSSGEAFLNLASELDSDFLVAGGYSHSKLRQSLLGGVTSHLLKHAEMPVLMAH